LYDVIGLIDRCYPTCYRERQCAMLDSMVDLQLSSDIGCIRYECIRAPSYAKPVPVDTIGADLSGYRDRDVFTSQKKHGVDVMLFDLAATF
jgi:hypothetical protein